MTDPLADDTSPEFSVYWWDRDNGQHQELRFVKALPAVKAARRLSHGPASQLGMVNRVIITDGGDCCVFEWLKGHGVVWPKQAAS
jgi:hypothetical protein